MSEWKVPVQSLIDHIKTAIDVDNWAKEMAEELLKEQLQIVRCEECKYWKANTQFCERLSDSFIKHRTPPDWFCAGGERKDDG